jgi:deoxyadenosine/deoxycytidine kinase
LAKAFPDQDFFADRRFDTMPRALPTDVFFADRRFDTMPRALPTDVFFADRQPFTDQHFFANQTSDEVIFPDQLSVGTCHTKLPSN